MMHIPNFDPGKLIIECRDIGNERLRDKNYAQAEEAFALGWTMYQSYGTPGSQTAGYGCLTGLFDCLRAQNRHAEADELLKSSRATQRRSA